MRIGLLVTSIGNFGQKGFYNAQEIGLAKELDKLFDEVIVYKAVPFNQERSKSLIDECEHSTLYQIPVQSKGINGMWNCDVMDASLDILIYFSDTQLAVPNVDKWCRKNHIQMYPYIGVVESHSTSIVKKLIVNALVKRNIAVYKKCICFVKTPKAAEKLNSLGIKNTALTPVGLDISLLHADYENTPVEGIREKYGYQPNDKVLLFIGRLIDEKQPVRMIDIFAELRKKDAAYKLLMVGTGELKAAAEARIKELDLQDAVQLVERIPNSDIWELYRTADAFVNLNQQEIFGMAILEAMYYDCKVVAWKAPGPSFIIEDGKSGFIVESNQELLERIQNGKLNEGAAHLRILNEFTWDKTANKIHQVMGNAK